MVVDEVVNCRNKESLYVNHFLSVCRVYKFLSVVESLVNRETTIHEAIPGARGTSTAVSRTFVTS